VPLYSSSVGVSILPRAGDCQISAQFGLCDSPNLEIAQSVSSALGPLVAQTLVLSARIEAMATKDEASKGRAKRRPLKLMKTNKVADKRQAM